MPREQSRSEFRSEGSFPRRPLDAYAITLEEFEQFNASEATEDGSDDDGEDDSEDGSNAKRRRR